MKNYQLKNLAVVFTAILFFSACNKNNITEQNNRIPRASIKDSYVFNQQKTEKMSDWLMGITSSKELSSTQLTTPNAILEIEAVLNYNFSRRISHCTEEYQYNFVLNTNQSTSGNMTAQQIQDLFEEIRLVIRTKMQADGIYNNSDYHINIIDLEFLGVHDHNTITCEVKLGKIKPLYFREFKVGDEYYPRDDEGNVNYGTLNCTYPAYPKWGASQVLQANANFNISNMQTYTSNQMYIPNPWSIPSSGMGAISLPDPTNPFQNNAIMHGYKSALYKTPKLSFTGGIVPTIPYNEMNYYNWSIINKVIPVVFLQNVPSMNFTINNISSVTIYSNEANTTSLPYSPHTYSGSQCGGDFGIQHGIVVHAGVLAPVTLTVNTNI